MLRRPKGVGVLHSKLTDSLALRVPSVDVSHLFVHSGKLLEEGAGGSAERRGLIGSASHAATRSDLGMGSDPMAPAAHSEKKTQHAAEQSRPEVAATRREWRARQPNRPGPPPLAGNDRDPDGSAGPAAD